MIGRRGGASAAFEGAAPETCACATGVARTISHAQAAATLKPLGFTVPPIPRLAGRTLRRTPRPCDVHESVDTYNH